MFDILLCYGFAANMIRAGYFGLVTDFFRQIWNSCHRLGAAAAARARRPSRSSAVHRRHAGQITLQRIAPLDTCVTSMT